MPARRIYSEFLFFITAFRLDGLSPLLERIAYIHPHSRRIDVKKKQEENKTDKKDLFDVF